MEPSSRTASSLSPGDVIAGKFRLERVIGRGGMGSVWAARHVQLDMPVALKFIETDGDAQDARLRFEREARAAGQIRSPHVVQILDHGIDGDLPYIAMELLEGEDLGQRLRREKRIPVPACARILTQAAKALRRAHEAGIIHRDLKPGNVFLARFDDDEVVKVLDFGVAKMRRAGAIEEPLATQVGIVFGSPSYMSPEQARGTRTLDHRSDLWSLAVIVYRSVTGVKPFQAASLADLVVKVCIDPLPVATRAAGDLPPEIDRFFERAFARDPDHRFSSAPEMAAAFEAVAAGAGAGVAPPPPSSSMPSLPPAQLAVVLQAAAGVAPAPQLGLPEPTTAFPVSAAPPSGSGPHAGFASGTLTPPPVPMGEPVPIEVPFRPPSPAALVAELTPGSGVSSLPSGGWGVAPPVPAPTVSQPVVPPFAAPPVVSSFAAPPPPMVALPTQPAPAQVTPPPARPPRPVVLVAGLAAGLLALILVVLLARPGASVTASAGSPGASASVPRGETPPSQPVPPPTPVPAESAAAPAPAESAAAPALAESASAPAPASSAQAPSPGTPTPRGPGRSGKKKKPNFGY